MHYLKVAQRSSRSYEQLGEVSGGTGQAQLSCLSQSLLSMGQSPHLLLTGGMFYKCPCWFREI